MSYILAKFDDNYADEFDVHGFMVMDQEYYNQFVKDLPKIKFPNEIWFGTNEGITFQSLDEYKKAFTFQEIDENEYLVLKKLFGNTYSDTIRFSHFLQIEYYDDEDDDY